MVSIAVASTDADVVFLEETSPEWEQALRATEVKIQSDEEEDDDDSAEESGP